MIGQTVPQPPPWRGKGDEIFRMILRAMRTPGEPVQRGIRRMLGNPLAFRLAIMIAGSASTSWFLLRRAFSNDGIGAFVLVITLGHILPYLIYVVGVRTRRGSQIAGLGLLALHALVFGRILMSQSSTAALGFLTSPLVLSGFAVFAGIVDLIAASIVARRSGREAA